MKMMDYVLLGIVAAAFAWALNNIGKGGCSSECHGCKGCALEKTIQFLKDRKNRIPR